jgi:hypothetical protein
MTCTTIIKKAIRAIPVSGGRGPPLMIMSYIPPYALNTGNKNIYGSRAGI